ncbi:hypothetical protein Ndes2526B_g04410 [Nannochloris sp. 'desiccata']
MDAGPRASGNAMYTTDLWGPDVNAILGQFFDDKLRRVYETLTHDYCDRTEKIFRIRSTLEVMEIPEAYSERELHSFFKENFALAVDDALLDAGKRFPMDKKSLLLEHLPRDIPCSNLLEVYKVPRNDPRISLRGENGVRVTKTATKGLPAGAFIGVYRGKSLIGLDEYRDIKYAPPGVDYLQFELEIESYTASAVHYNIGFEAVENGITFEGLDPIEPSYSSVHVCAARYGNLTALVNDPSLDPMGNTTIETIGEDNTCLVEIIVGGWPCIVMFASKAINPGEELRYSYGHSFWKYVHGATKRLNAARGIGNGNLGGGGGGGGDGGGGSGDDSGSDALGGAVGRLVDDAATPMRSRQPYSQPSAATPLPGTNSDLAPTEEQQGGDDVDDNDGDGGSEFGADSRIRRACQVAEEEEEAVDDEEMMSSPHGKRLKLYSKKTELGKIQAENNGFASKKQFEAVQRRVEENPKIESGGESEEGEEGVVGPPVQAAKPLLTKKSSKKVNGKAQGRAASITERAARKRKAAAESVFVKKEPLENSGGSGAPPALPTTEEDIEINKLTTAVEAANVAFKIAKTKLNSAETLVGQMKLRLAELQPEEEEADAPAATTAAIVAAQPAGKPRLLWTKARIFALFREIEHGTEVLVGPWDVSQLENALESNQAPADREVFLHPCLDGNDGDVEIREALESLGPVPESGMWKLAELLDAAHPEALVGEAETLVVPSTAAAAARTAAAAAVPATKRKRLNPQQARKLKEAEKQLEQALEKMEERVKLVQEKEEAVALVRKELQRALGDDDNEEEEEQVDPEVAKANARAAGKRPAVDTGPSGGGRANRNGNGNAQGVKSPKLTPSRDNGTGTTIGADGAGTSAAHAAEGVAQRAGEGNGVWAAFPPQKAPAVAPTDDDVIDLTFDSD